MKVPLYADTTELHLNRSVGSHNEATAIGMEPAPGK